MDDPQCDEFKKKEDERICHLRKTFVEHVREEMRKRK